MTVRRHDKLMLSYWFLLFLATVMMTEAQQTQAFEKDRLLDESEYRSDLEEVLVVGQQPEWRKKSNQQQWRPKPFELQAVENPSRMKWLPEYTEDERDQYNEVRDRKNEKAKFQLFNWTF